MAKVIGQEALKPNPALEAWRVLVGEWETVGSHGLLPGVTLHGRARFEWIEGGAFLLMRTEIDEPQIPSGIAIFGSDDSTREFFMIYFDERGVSRKYDASFEDNVLKWWRSGPEFSQTYTVTVADGGKRMIGKGELSKDGSTWEKDLDLTYTRVR